MYFLLLNKNDILFVLNAIFFDRIRIGTTSRPGDNDIALSQEAKREQETSAASESHFDQRINQSSSSKRKLAQAGYTLENKTLTTNFKGKLKW